MENITASNFKNAADFGFSPDAAGIENSKALQKAVDHGGTIVVTKPGTYKIADTVYLGSNTSLLFGNNIFLKKVDEFGLFTHVFLNKGALTKTFDHNIVIDGLQILVNNIDVRNWKVYGLHGQIAFFYVKDLKITRFRCPDLGKAQYCVHVCTFEDFIIDDAIIKGEKDGVHLGRGKRFTIRNCVFQTFDDAIALNAHDYSTGNPELGWIENGIVENCYDLNAENTTGFFCRILAGGWVDWFPGMEVQQSDTVVSNNRLYRVQAKPDGTVYKSMTQPVHPTGTESLNGINWGVVQDEITYTAGVRNVSFRDIFLEKPRTSFSVHFDTGRYSRSYYPGAEIPIQEQFFFDNIRVLHEEDRPFILVNTPVDVLQVCNSSLRNNRIEFISNNALADHPGTKINIHNCVFRKQGSFEILRNSIAGKEIEFNTSANVELNKDFRAIVTPENGSVSIKSDLTGLK